MPRKTIYISPDMEKIWAEIEQAAHEEKRGIGFVLCEMWKSLQTLRK